MLKEFTVSLRGNRLFFAEQVTLIAAQLTILGYEYIDYTAKENEVVIQFAMENYCA